MNVNFDNKNINYNYDDYRNEIRLILERNNKRIKISEVLKKCGISKGNYYVFMKGGREYKNSVVSTLSYAKLDKLISELRKKDTLATNREKLRAMTDKELADFIEKKIIMNPNSSQIDVYSWLKSNDSKIIYRKKTKDKVRKSEKV